MRQRLDSEWCDLFLSASIFHLATSTSDHCLIQLRWLGSSLGSRPRRIKLFRFESMCIRHEECENVVLGALNSKSIEVSSEEKILLCSQAFMAWNAATFGNVQRQLRMKN